MNLSDFGIDAVKNWLDSKGYEVERKLYRIVAPNTVPIPTGIKMYHN